MVVIYNSVFRSSKFQCDRVATARTPTGLGDEYSRHIGWRQSIFSPKIPDPLLMPDLIGVLSVVRLFRQTCGTPPTATSLLAFPFTGSP
jgi:hypothetical protein